MNHMDGSYLVSCCPRSSQATSSATTVSSQRYMPHYPTIHKQGLRASAYTATSGGEPPQGVVQSASGVERPARKSALAAGGGFAEAGLAGGGDVLVGDPVSSPSRRRQAKCGRIPRLDARRSPQAVRHLRVAGSDADPQAGRPAKVIGGRGVGADTT